MCFVCVNIAIGVSSSNDIRDIVTSKLVLNPCISFSPRINMFLLFSEHM